MPVPPPINGRGILAIAAIAAIVLSACSTPDANPSQARAGVGYVDLIPPDSEPLSWDVHRVDRDSGRSHKLYSNLTPYPTPPLRLALPPGNHTLAVDILNRITLEPSEVTVNVEEGRVTPVRLRLSPVSQTSYADVSYGGRSTAFRRRRQANVDIQELDVLSITLDPQPSETFRPKPD